MTPDLPDLVRHLSRLALAGGGICAVVAFSTFVMSQDKPAAQGHDDAVIVLGTLAAVQVILWFGLLYWADQAVENPGPDPGVDDWR